MNATSLHARNRDLLRDRRDARPFDLDEALARVPPVRQPPLPLRLWHHRHSVVLGGAVPAALMVLGAVLHPIAPVFLLLTAALAYVTTPEMRRWVLGRARCIQVPHLVRESFRSERICAPDGRTPIVMWTSRVRCGVRVRLLCPPGMPPERLEGAADVLKESCGADEVVVAQETGSRTVIIGLGYAPRGWWWER